MTDTMHYGPQTAEVEALLARVRALSGTEAKALGAAWGAVRSAARYAAWDVARVAARSAAWDAALDAAWDAALDAARVAVLDAALDAALALVVRDLITPDGFTQEHYDLLTGPWRRVVGRVHPDDAEMVAA